MARALDGLRDRFKTSPMLIVFLVSYVAVHLHFEYNFWMLADSTVFDKYAAASDPLGAMAIAQQVYYAKAVWCFLLIVLQAAGLRFYPALAISFLVYGVALLGFFPIRVYTVLNLLLAIGMMIEVVRLGKAKETPDRDFPNFSA